jgi:hypothetical protein
MPYAVDGADFAVGGGSPNASTVPRSPRAADVLRLRLSMMTRPSRRSTMGPVLGICCRKRAEARS